MHRRKLILTERWQFFKNQSYRPFIKSSKSKRLELNVSLVSGIASPAQQDPTTTASGPTATLTSTAPGSTSTCSLATDHANGRGFDQSPCQMDMPTAAQSLTSSTHSEKCQGASSLQCVGGASSTTPCHPISQSGPAKESLNVGNTSVAVGHQSFLSLLSSSSI